MAVFQVIFLILFPAVIIYMLQKFKKLSFLSPILLCYVFGIIIANLPIPFDRGISLTISEISVPLAIPLTLFQTRFKSWIHLAGKMVLSFVLVCISAIVASIVSSLVFKGFIPEYWKLAGMLVGVYTGGTPNLVAVGMGLDVSESTLILANTSDAILGGIYFLILISVAKRFLRFFLPPYKQKSAEVETEDIQERLFTAELFLSSNGRGKLYRMIAAFFISMDILVIGAGISYITTGSFTSVVVIMLTITTLGIACSFVGKIRNIKGTYEIGQYLIFVFSLAIGTTVNFTELINASNKIFLFTTMVMWMAIIIHFILAAIFRIDTDTAIITSTAGIFGPPFIAPVVNAIKNKEMLVPGFTCGLVGYAVGNYLGFLTSYLVMPR